MLRVCDNCGIEFEGAAQARFHSDACRKAYARKLGQIEGELGHNGAPELGQAEPGQPEVGQPFEPGLRSLEDLITHGRSGGQLTAEEEQRIRDHFGYTASETRTLAQRDETARRITGTPSTTEEEYVRLMMSDSRLLNRKRAERYARWRYREFVRGEVASL